MTKVTVTLFGDREIEVGDDEVENLRSQGLLTSVEGESEETVAAAVDESVIPAPELVSADAPKADKAAPVKEAKAANGGDKAPASK